MATVSAVVLKSELKKDGTWNVKIRVWHKNKPMYIPTEHFVTAKQLKSDGSIKDPIIINRKPLHKFHGLYGYLIFESLVGNSGPWNNISM